jgi:exodeoxyribonuclease V alpha subunit
VALVLPPQAPRELERELLYTAVTRARDAVTIWGEPEAFALAVGRRLERSSGLRDALWPDLP